VSEKPLTRSHARSVTPLADAILGAMQASGPAVFSKLVRDRAANFPHPSEAARSLLGSARTLASRMRKEGVKEVARQGLETARQGLQLAANAPGKISASVQASRDYFTKLPTTQDKAEYVVAVVLYLLSFLGGFAVGFQVPQVDLKMKRTGAPGDRIVLHAFPLMAVELAADWITAVLEQVREAKNLSPQDYRRAESLVQIARNLRAGLRTGAATLAWQRKNLGLLPMQGKKDVEVALHKQAFAHAEHLFRSLTQGDPK
jgi:hypothetical protein